MKTEIPATSDDGKYSPSWRRYGRGWIRGICPVEYHTPLGPWAQRVGDAEIGGYGAGYEWQINGVWLHEEN